jgi:hypothetical protein
MEPDNCNFLMWYVEIMYVIRKRLSKEYLSFEVVKNIFCWYICSLWTLLDFDVFVVLAFCALSLGVCGEVPSEGM